MRQMPREAQTKVAVNAMEYPERHDWMRDTEQAMLFPVSNALQIALLAAATRNHAHQQNVEHRDIKPAKAMFIPLAAIMYSSTNEKQPDITPLRKELTPIAKEISVIIGKVLEKQPQDRYQPGGELARKFCNCLIILKKK